MEEQWRRAGTVLVKDINPGSGSSFPDYLTNVNGTLFFNATDVVHGRELWSSNGSATGTVLVKDINPGTHSSSPEGLTNVNGSLFFGAFKGAYGGLWTSNGTAAGTFFVKDISDSSTRRTSTGHCSSQPTTAPTGVSYGQATAAPPAPSSSRTSTPAVAPHILGS